MSRVCPDDGGALEVRTIHNIEVDLCPRCGGIWLDKGEIVRLRKLKTEEIKDFELTPLQPPTSHPHTAACPICASPLQLFQYANGKATLATCSDLHGIWMPAAELQKIADMQTLHLGAAAAAGAHGALMSDGIDHITRVGLVLSVLDTQIGWPPHWGVF